ncbi:MAG: sodium:solute symporter family transporter, partial [Limisphaerales bacterium]
MIWITNTAAIGEPTPSTFIANDIRSYVDSYKKSLATKIVESAKDATDKLKSGQATVNREIAWTFEGERVPELLFKWCWIRAVSQQQTPDYLVYSSDLVNVTITPESHKPLTNIAAANFLEHQFASNQLTFRSVEPGVLVVYSEAAKIYADAALAEFTQLALIRKHLPEKAPADQKWISPFGPLTTKAAAKAGLKAEEQKPFSLLYTYSLIIALVCGTAGLPHILVRFYTNPDGVAAKRTTMWVMILIGVFYVFPPVFGVMGRNLLPELYLGVGSKGTDKVVLELPRILNEKVGKWESEKVGETPGATGSLSHPPTFSPAANTANNRNKIPWGSILSGITCAGAFAAFMSTFSGLLVSMTGALAHDVYG